MIVVDQIIHPNFSNESFYQEQLTGIFYRKAAIAFHRAPLHPIAAMPDPMAPRTDSSVNEGRETPLQVACRRR
jgi:hypothetical protein